MLLYILLILPMLIPITWVLYLAIMNLQRVRDLGNLSKPAYYLGTVILYIGLFFDFILNQTGVTIMFLDLPKEFLVTQRLKRYKHGKDGWRKSLANWWAVNLLDPFDPKGIHVD